MRNASRYRVEFRTNDHIHVLAIAADARPNIRSLDPYISRLVHAGKAGDVALVNCVTGKVVAIRTIPPVASPARSRNRRRFSLESIVQLAGLDELHQIAPNTTSTAGSTLN